MAKALSLQDPEVFAIPSGIFLSFTDENGERRTNVTRVRMKGIHLQKVDEVNRISRALAAGELQEGELQQRLEAASRKGDDLPAWFAPLMAFISAAGFAVMFGGSWVDMLVGGFCAALTIVVPLLTGGWSGGGVGGVLSGGVICAFVPLLFHALTGLGNTGAMIAAAVMPLVPGVSMSNGVQDILRGDMVSGCAHASRALIIAALLAGGALVGAKVFSFLPMTDLPQQAAPVFKPLAEAVVMAVAAGIAGAAFGALLYAPLRSLGWGTLLAGLVYLLYWCLDKAGLSSVVSMFFAGMATGIGALFLARHTRIISTVYVMIASLPLLPGLGLYRAMEHVAQGQYAEGMGQAVAAMGIILMIAMGAAIGPAMIHKKKKG